MNKLVLITRKEPIVMVAFSMGLNESRAMLNYIYEPLSILHRVKLRPHPFLPIDKIVKEIKKPFEIDTLPLEESLAETKVLIGGGTGVAVQALAYGCKVIVVNIPEYINMSPLYGQEDENLTFTYSKEDFKNTLKALLNEN